MTQLLEELLRQRLAMYHLLLILTLTRLRPHLIRQGVHHHLILKQPLLLIHLNKEIISRVLDSELDQQLTQALQDSLLLEIYLPPLPLGRIKHLQ